MKPDQTFDVVVIGGALSGAATALLLLREKPGLRVVIVEKSESLNRRVGEATVEISAYFLGKILGLSEHLAEKHLSKQGLRFWFQNDRTHTLPDCSEIGPKYQVRLPGYQVDRAVLDEEVLARACAAGAKILRPAKVVRYALVPGGMQSVVVTSASGEMEIAARWIVDASGVVGTVGRGEGWIRRNTEHPIAALWSRWSGVTGWDSLELTDRHPAWGKRVFGTRNTATNHLCGKGWWAWVIPLKGGDVSIGVVFDTRLVSLPEGPCLGTRLRTLLESHPAGKEILEHARFTPGDVMYRNNLAYVSEVFAQDGVALVGDAAAFMDPFYSPGMDWITFTSMRTVRLILDGDSTAGTDPIRLESHNRDFRLCYARWFTALYKDKYYYMGDCELMLIGFRLDLGLYYLGVVRGPITGNQGDLLQPPFSLAVAGPFYGIMRHYNRRLAAIGKKRMREGRWGATNANQWHAFNSFTFDSSLVRRIAGGLISYALLEFRELLPWRWRAAGMPRKTPGVSVDPAPVQT